MRWRWWKKPPPPAWPVIGGPDYPLIDLAHVERVDKWFRTHPWNNAHSWDSGRALDLTIVHNGIEFSSAQRGFWGDSAHGYVGVANAALAEGDIDLWEFATFLAPLDWQYRKALGDLAKSRLWDAVHWFTVDTDPRSKPS